ncbi:MAG: hypothetical protein JO188_21060 [Hyphomicrobiales bacterium]|nr:hypothetical protein [Hyphomicrobiales bacterium]
MYTTEDPSRKFVVEMLVDGHVVKIVRAADYDHELARAGEGDGCNGFSVFLPRSAIADGMIVEARIANLGDRVGVPLELTRPSVPHDVDGPGRVYWRSGLRLTGFLSQAAQHPSRTVVALIDDEIVARAAPTGWTHVEGRPLRSFALDLPARFADGKVKHVIVRMAEGEDLAGSPVALVAFDDGLGRMKIIPRPSGERAGPPIIAN